VSSNLIEKAFFINLIHLDNLNKDKKNIPIKKEGSKDLEKREESKLKNNKGKYPADFFTGS
tara:strand:+ start:343 stop:525 length:183 start_codon:yes stop_codon:yes gene_type:complete